MLLFSSFDAVGFSDIRFSLELSFAEFLTGLIVPLASFGLLFLWM